MSETTAPAQASLSGALRRYQVAAYIVGVMLIVACAFSISEYVFDKGEGRYIWVVHGWFYVVYLGLAFDLFRRARWPLGRLAEMLVAGWLPGLTFVIERRITRLAAGSK